MDGTQGPRTERPQTANRRGAVVVTGERLARPTPMVGRQVQPQVQPGPDAQGPPESTNTVWGLPVWALVIAAFAGTALALVTIPTWVPVLGTSAVGAEPKMYWYLSRASGFTSFALLWLSMASGLLISNKMARIWPGGFTAFDLHQFTSLLGLGFAVFHAVILLGNKFIPNSVVQLLVPFSNDVYRPLWIAVGQVCFYMALPVTFTFYVRKPLGYRAWHVIHFLGYAVFGMALLHGLFSGTDSGNVWVVGIYWVGALSIILLTVYRVMVSRISPVRQGGQ